MSLRKLIFDNKSAYLNGGYYLDEAEERRGIVVRTSLDRRGSPKVTSLTETGAGTVKLDWRDRRVQVGEKLYKLDALIRSSESSSETTWTVGPKEWTILRDPQAGVVQVYTMMRGSLRLICMFTPYQKRSLLPSKPASLSFDASNSETELLFILLLITYHQVSEWDKARSTETTPFPPDSPTMSCPVPSAAW